MLTHVSTGTGNSGRAPSSRKNHGSLWGGGERGAQAGSGFGRSQEATFAPRPPCLLGLPTVWLCVACAVTEVRGQKAQLCGLRNWWHKWGGGRVPCLMGSPSTRGAPYPPEAGTLSSLLWSSRHSASAGDPELPSCHGNRLLSASSLGWPGI